MIVWLLNKKTGMKPMVIPYICVIPDNDLRYLRANNLGDSLVGIKNAGQPFLFLHNRFNMRGEMPQKWQF